MDINIDKEHGYVSWHNGDNTVTRKVGRIERACYHEDDNYVEVFIGEYGEDGYIVFSMDGDIVCSVDLIRQQYVFLNFKDILPERTKNVMFYKKRNALYCLYEYGGINAIRLICGDRSVTIDIPAGIHPQYMLAMDSRATLVAETDEADQYGRYRWNYTIDSENKIICKRCLAY